MRQWRIARQVWAKPSVRDILWLVGCLSKASQGCARVHWHIGCWEEFRLTVREGGRCRPGSLALGDGTTVCDSHTLSTAQQQRTTLLSRDRTRGHIRHRSLTARDFCVAMWWASKTGIAEADATNIHCHSWGFTSIFDGICPSTTTRTTCTSSTNKKTLQRDKHSLSVAPPHECLEEANAQNNLSPKYWSHKIVLDHPSASVLPFAVYADRVSFSNDDSIFGLMRVSWMVHVFQSSCLL